MERNKPNHGGGIKHRLTQMLLRSACTISTANATTSFISISKNGTNQEREEEPPGTPSLSMLLQKHRHEKQVNASIPKLERSSSSRTTPVIQVSIDCGSRRALHGTNQNHVPVPIPAKEETTKKKKKSNGSYQSSKKNSPVSPSSPVTRSYYSSQETRRKKIIGKPRRKQIKKLQSNPYGFSTSSSAHSDMEPGLFSSEGEEGEVQTVFSSKSFSSDSSEVYQCTNKPKTIHVQPRKAVESPSRSAKRDIDVNKRQVSVSSKDRKAPDSASGSLTGTATSTGTGTGPGRAVVKKSCNPYMDFRSSMVEMIVEQKVLTAKEMERLLQSYLALNATHHHPVIVRAFEDICEAIFTDE